jgi:hypothetical protein
VADAGGAGENEINRIVFGSIMKIYTFMGEIFLVKLCHAYFLAGEGERNLNEERHALHRLRNNFIAFLIFSLILLVFSDFNPHGLITVIILTCLTPTVMLPDFVDYLLAHKGRLLQASIRECTGRLEMPDWFDLYIEYQFTSPMGKSIVNRQWNNRVDLKNVELPPPGTQLLVLYVNDWLYRLM